MTTNPYSAEAVEYAAPTNVRPGGITVVGVLTLVLAGLGICAGLVGLGGQVFTRSMADSIIAQSEANPENEALKLQADLQKETLAVAEKYMIPNVVANIVSLIVCLGLFVGAIMLLSGSAKGRSLLMSLFVVVILVDIGKAALQFVVQKETMASMEKGFMQGMNAGAQSNGGEVPEDVEEVMGTALKVGAIIGMIFLGGWLLGKIVFYVWGRSYLKKPDIVAWFNSKSSGAGPQPGHIA